MANNSNLILQGKPPVTGGVLCDPTNAVTLPTTATAALPTGFIALGYVSEDGLSMTQDRSTDKIKAWGGDTVKVVQTDYGVTFSWTFMQTADPDVLRAVYGAGNVTVTPATSTAGTQISIKGNADVLPRARWVFEMKDGNARVRIVVPVGQISAVGDLSFTDGDAIAYEVTLDTFPDSSGNSFYKYIDDGIRSA